MSKPKKTTTITISEAIIDEINKWREICHNNDLLINRSDLIAILLMGSLERLEEDVQAYSMEEIVDGFGVCLHKYYDAYDLAVRREAGAE